MNTIIFRSSPKGARRQSDPNLIKTSLEKALRDSKSESSQICKYLSSASAVVPYERIRIAAKNAVEEDGFNVQRILPAKNHLRTNNALDDPSDYRKKNPEPSVEGRLTVRR